MIAGKEFTLCISNEDKDGIIKIVKLLGDPGLFIDGATETVKHELKKQEGGFLGAMMAPIAAMASSLIQPLASSLINAASEKVVMRARKGQKGGFLPLLELLLMMKVLGKGVTRTGR